MGLDPKDQIYVLIFVGLAALLYLGASAAWAWVIDWLKKHGWH